MPFNGSGTFVPLTPPDYPAADGETIFSGAYNNVVNDLIGGLTNCMTRDGQSPATADISFGGFHITNLGGITGPLNQSYASPIASSSTINLTTATGDTVDVTGTTTITAITLAQGAQRKVIFGGALTLTHSSNLLLPGDVDIVTAAGDVAEFVGLSGGVVKLLDYTPNRQMAPCWKLVWTAPSYPTHTADVTAFLPADGAVFLVEWEEATSGSEHFNTEISVRPPAGRDTTNSTVYRVVTWAPGGGVQWWVQSQLSADDGITPLSCIIQVFEGVASMHIYRVWRLAR